MVEIALGESVKSVRSKLGIESTDYHTAWGTLNVGAALAWEPSLTLQQRKAQEICLKRFGNIPLKEAGILGGIDELKDYYRLHVDPLKDGKTGSKILETLEVKGAAAWIIHNAVKRNYDKHRKGEQHFVFEYVCGH